jgi:GNAT superfamily N-acetyltransferase
MTSDSRLITDHSEWERLAAPPDGLVFAREEGRLAPAEFIAICECSGLTRPIRDPDRIAAMIANSNLLITARDGEGRLAGLARSLTDFAYCCYLSDLCVDRAWQGRHVGRALVAETKRIVGPRAMLLLLSAAAPMSYYPHIGMDVVQNGFIIRRSA